MGLGLRVEGLGFRVEGLGFRVEGLGGFPKNRGTIQVTGNQMKKEIETAMTTGV